VIDNQTRPILLELLNFSSLKKIKLFVVGGTLRDHILNKNISDIDLTGKNAAELGTQFAQSLSFSYVPLDKTPGRATTRIILPDSKHFDLTDMQGTTIEEDLAKRDFTINAMGQELSDFLSSRETIIDLHEGKKDLNKAIVKATSNSVFKDDPLRMLRAFRFAATMNFSIKKETLNGISQYKKNISTTAGERIWQELLSFFEADATGELINLMQESKLLPYLLPEATKNWEKTLAFYKRLETIISNLDFYFPKHTLPLSDSEKALLKISVLLKEMDTNPSMENKNIKNYGTPKTFEALKALKASNSEISFICKTIQNSHFFSRSLANNLNDSSLYNLCVKGGDQLVAGLLLKVCTLPFLENSECEEIEKFNSCTQLLEFYFAYYLPVLGEKALLNGNDIIRIFNISPSPALGNVLENIQRAQVLGEIKTSTEAEALVKEILKSQEQN